MGRRKGEVRVRPSRGKEKNKTANVFEFVVHEAVKCDDGPDETGEIDDQQLVVGDDCQGFRAIYVSHGGGRGEVDIGKQVKDVLQIVDDLVVHR